MPKTIFGIGTSFCGALGCVRWKPKETWLFPDAPDHDAMICVGLGHIHSMPTLVGVPVFIPVLPLRSYHTYDWDDDQCQVIRIKTTFHLWMRAMLRPYLHCFLMGFAFLIVLCLVALCLNPSPLLESLAGASWSALLLWSLIPTTWWLSVLWMVEREREERNIRLVIGRHRFGHSDPALWMPEMLEPELHRAENGELAVLEMMERGDFSLAMWTARIGVACKKPWGKRMTKKILQEPRVKDALMEIGRQTWLRDQYLPRLVDCHDPLSPCRN